ncbi:MAG: hypothetical protein M0P61_01795 [Ignavibacteriaceae bacterium]|nr:hypothetical protein [Ignavibacteriaceae bacterium]
MNFLIATPENISDDILFSKNRKVVDAFLFLLTMHYQLSCKQKKRLQVCS